jgi:AraC family transcriptional activator of pobA
MTADIEHAFAAIVKEAESQTKGSTTMIEAQMRALLVRLWRNAEQGPEPASAAGRTPQVLQHFRQLLETHFRARWPISLYAAAIGVTPDRLHDICRRHVGRAPSVLVQERLIHESRMMQENTAMSADLISATIGFRDASYFSRFFKTRVGLPPVACRASHLKARQTDAPPPQHSYSDWP